jgi:hypothetical protein
MKGKMMKPAFAKKGYMDGGKVKKMANGGMVQQYMPAPDSQRMGQMAAPASARGMAARGAMKMADGGYACGKAGSLTGKNMKKGSK